MLATTARRKPYLEHLALLLENEGAFYDSYQTRSADNIARNLIEHWENKLRLKDEQLRDMGTGTTADEREILRRYLNDKWTLKQEVDGNRGTKPAPFTLYEEPAPVKRKPATPELATDWAALPDGTTLITASGAKYTKGPGTIDQGCHPVSISSMKEQASKGFVVGVSHKSRGSWNRWDKDGLSCSDTGKVYDTMTGHRLVSYELPVKQDPKAEKPPTFDLAKTPFKQIGPVDYTKLPDGTRLFTKQRGVFIKGRRPPSNVKDFPKLLVGKDLGGRTDRPVVGYQLKPDGSWEGWMEWTATGESGPGFKDEYALTGYDATPSGGLMPALNLNLNPIDRFADHINVTQLKEDIMNAIITITTKTLVNGQDVANFTNAQLYDLIAQQEKKLAELDAIKNKPKALKKELADRQAGIDALVAHLDSRDDSAAK